MECENITQVQPIEISNNKHQITNKLQIAMSKTALSGLFSNTPRMFGILNFGHCDLFGI